MPTLSTQEAAILEAARAYSRAWRPYREPLPAALHASNPVLVRISEDLDRARQALLSAAAKYGL